MKYRYIDNPQKLIERAFIKDLPTDLEYIQGLRVNLLDAVRNYKTFNTSRFASSKTLSGPAYEFQSLKDGLDRVLKHYQILINQ